MILKYLYIALLTGLNFASLAPFQKIVDSQRLADINISKLKVESERLEAHTKSCSWWVWVMLVIVIMTFISMVLFMRIFSK